MGKRIAKVILTCISSSAGNLEYLHFHVQATREAPSGALSLGRLCRGNVEASIMTNIISSYFRSIPL